MAVLRKKAEVHKAAFAFGREVFVDPVMDIHVNLLYLDISFII